MAALRDVDYVVLFSDPNVEALLDFLRPTSRQGHRFTADTVPERATAARLGIRVAIVGDPKDHSPRSFLSSVHKAPMSEPRFLVCDWSLGEIVHTFPAVAALRETFPIAKMVWMTHRRGNLSWRAAALLRKSGPPRLARWPPCAKPWRVFANLSGMPRINSGLVEVRRASFFWQREAGWDFPRTPSANSASRFFTASLGETHRDSHC